MRLLCALLLSVLLLVGCRTDNSTMQLIERAEAVVIEYPDSALNILRTVDVETIRGEEDMAHYRLVLAETYYHNYIDHGLDSLTSLFYDYYLYSDDHPRRARAMFQHARAMYISGDISTAFCAIHESEKSLASTTNNRLKGLVYSQKGDIYNSQCLFVDALLAYQVSYSYFTKAQLPYHAAYAQYDIAAMYSHSREYSDAVECLLSLIEKSIDLGDSSLLILSRLELSFVYLQQYDFIKCAEVLDSIDVSELAGSNLSDYYCVCAIVEASRNSHQEADRYLNLAKEVLPSSDVHISYTDYMLSYLRGDYQQSLHSHLKMVDQQDVYVHKLISDSPLHYNIELLTKDIHSTKELVQKRETINYLIYTIIVVAFVLCLYLIHTSNRTKRQRISLLVAQVDSVQSELRAKRAMIKNISTVAEEKRYELAKLQCWFMEKINQELQTISQLLDAYYIDGTKNRKHREIISIIDNYVETFADSPNGYFAVEQFVNQYRNNIMELLRSEFTSLKESDYRLLCLVYADFSSNAICMFMSYDKNKLYKHKSRLKSVISQSDSKYRDLFLKYMR